MASPEHSSHVVPAIEEAINSDILEETDNDTYELSALTSPLIATSPPLFSLTSNTSQTSVKSTLFERVPNSSRSVFMSVPELCSYILDTPNAVEAHVMALIRRKERGGVAHEFLLLRVRKPDGRDMWLRLERRPRNPLRLLISSSADRAADSVRLIINRQYICMETDMSVYV